MKRFEYRYSFLIANLLMAVAAPLLAESYRLHPETIAAMAGVAEIGCIVAFYMRDRFSSASLTNVFIVSQVIPAVLLLGTSVSVAILLCGVFMVLFDIYTSSTPQKYVKAGILAAIGVLAVYMELNSMSILSNFDKTSVTIIMLAVYAECVAAYVIYEKRQVKQIAATKSARDDANRDKLTGLLNRRTMELFTDKVSKKAGSFSVLMIDIDHFKKVNDSYGHLEGDKILKCLADTTLKCTRGEDRVFRYGGEEFCVVCPGTDKNAARVVAERIRREFNALTFDYGGGPVHFSVSIGVSECRYGEYTSFEDTVKKSDDALYIAKESGRNRVELYMP